LKRILSSAAFGLLWVVVIYVCWVISVRHRYLAAFDATQQGDDVALVLKRFGSPSRIERPVHVVGYVYQLRFWYESPFSLGVSPVSVDLDSNLVVVNKYQWNSP
jgi:hypothetical protein